MDDKDFALLLERTMLSINYQTLESKSNVLLDSPIVFLVNQIINEALAKNATDIHIEPLKNGTRIRIRIDGFLYNLHNLLPQALHILIVSRLKIMSELNTVENRMPQDGRFSYVYEGQDIDVRVSIVPVMDGEKVVLRLLNRKGNLLTIQELNFSKVNEKLFRKWCNFPHGMLLVVGPVNSGKTTTLYTALNELNKTERSIVTLEDPIEYALLGINQIQVNTKVNLTFSVGLRAILRQDPDIIMLGEIRDEETAAIAIKTALTGKLLFTTMHTGTAAGAIFRLLDMHIPFYLLSSAVVGIIAQRLVRRLCPYCRKPYFLQENTLEANFIGTKCLENQTFYEAIGCDKCDFIGYKGRIALQEFLALNDVLSNAIKNRQDLPAFEALQETLGMKTLLDDGIEKALIGETSLQEVRRVLYGTV